MTARLGLTARLTAFTLGALALVLAGFSATTFLVARSELSRQADDRLAAALATLTAAVEFHPGGLEWEPGQRLLGPGLEVEAGEIRWTVRDGRGAAVDRSPNLRDPRLLDRLPVPPGPGARSFRRVRLGGRPWRVAQRRYGAGPAAGPLPDRHHADLVLTAALCLEPADAAARHLGRLLAGVSIGVWLLAAAVGRSFCRGALRPLTRMADAAHGIGATGFHQRIPSPGTGDELQDLADAFNGLLDRLHVSFERQARFTGDASHQLRTPLAAVLGQIDVALRRERCPDDYRQTLRLVREKAAHLGRIVETLLFLARAEAEAGLPDREVIDLAGWARDRLLAWADHPRAVDISLEADAGAVPARVHPTLLGQCFDNLLDNACKYSEPGSSVTVRVGREAGGSVLGVADLGPGIDPEDLPHVFEPFYRSPATRRQGRPGVGLGLSIARRIARAFGGELTAVCPPGGGSVFTLRLPAVPGDVAIDPRAAARLTPARLQGVEVAPGAAAPEGRGGE